jgi:hypothetical protein
VLAGLPHAGGCGGKKLVEAARLWARGELVTEREAQRRRDENRRDLDDDLACFGLVAEGSLGDADDIQVFALWPENVEAWSLFMECQTKWRSSFAGRTGLDDAGVDRVLWRMRVRPKNRRRRIEEIALMERAALAEWAARGQAGE